MVSFTLEKTSGKARAGVLISGERTVQTPFFMPVSTKGTIKHLTFDQLSRVGTEAVIMNAFILSLRPGEELVKAAGGLHKFTTYDGVIATDSGGFQVLSPTFVHDKNNRGVYFRDPYSGQVNLFTPEYAMQVQHALGSDIAMALDDQPPFTQEQDTIQVAVDQTLAWAKRCVTEQESNSDRVNPHQKLFLIGQGGIFTDVRKSCAEALVAMNCDAVGGYAVGGLAIGEPPARMYEAIATQTSIYPEDKPRYVMGLGSPVDVLEAIARGADMFDSIFATQSARRGTLFTTAGLVRVGSKKFREDFSLVDVENPLLSGITKSYVHHLLRVDEAAGMQLASLQNLWFMKWLMDSARFAILSNTFDEFKERIKALWA